MQPLQKGLAAQHERYEDHVGRRAFARDNFRAPFRCDVLQRGDDDGDVAEGVDDQNEQNRRGKELGVHRPWGRFVGWARSISRRPRFGADAGIIIRFATARSASCRVHPPEPFA